MLLADVEGSTRLWETHAERDAYDAIDPAARLFGAADAAHQRMGMVRFKVLEAEDEARIVTTRDGLGTDAFQAA